MAASYYRERENRLTLATRDLMRELPPVVNQFMLSIKQTTQPLTRYAYACDLKLFFGYLMREVPRFAGRSPALWTDDDFASVTSTDVYAYLDYLSYYIRDDDTEVSNQDQAKQRKLSSLRRFYNYLYKTERIESNVMMLVDMPKKHEKPILRMEIDEVMRMLDLASSTETFEGHQRAYNEKLHVRDTAILMLFLGTGIRVSELVGLDIQDIDFSMNAFSVTRKGGSQAILYFSEEVADAIRAYLDERNSIEAVPGHENALFLSTQRKRMGVRAVENMVKKYATMSAPLKKRLSPHKLRSTFGTNLYHETGDIYLVAESLGHKDVNTTRRHYAAMSDDRKRLVPQYIKLRDTDPPPENPDSE